MDPKIEERLSRIEQRLGLPPLVDRTAYNDDLRRRMAVTIGYARDFAAPYLIDLLCNDVHNTNRDHNK